MVKLIAILGIVLGVIDQISKWIVKIKYKTPIGNDIFSITLVQNTGIAFGWNPNNTKNIVLTLIVLLVFIHFIRNQKERMNIPTAITIALILAGGCSNLLDRIVRGGVIDFIQISNFPIFNIADCYIVIGWILLIVFFIKNNKEMVGEKDCEKQ